MRYLRLIAIWITGLLAFSMFGALPGVIAGNEDSSGVGFLSGICLFICLRLWSAEHRPVRDMTAATFD
jgi:hypothetical protein